MKAKSIGLIELPNFADAVEAVDVMLKAADIIWKQNILVLCQRFRLLLKRVIAHRQKMRACVQAIVAKIVDNIFVTENR